MTEVTKDRDFKTNVNVESQTINYIKNPEKFKEDLQKAKNEIYDIYYQERQIRSQINKREQKKIGENAKGRRIYKTKEGYTIYADDFHSKVEYEVFNKKGKHIGTISTETIIKNGFHKEDIDTSKKDPKKRIDK